MWSFLVLRVVVCFLQRGLLTQQWQWDVVLHGVVGVQLCFP